ncbi:hypothetical protein H4R20_000632 [Coemansia guatemalensis]|uniref:Uncharacterized protein n=1 Tax=Coemansia guatemalensis TaxID=2761395 RepID=A0A9W8I142_9FUNG|nr:hypothetical protein H4R20_000632 [Coemansia guatemalensis]
MPSIKHRAALNARRASSDQQQQRLQLQQAQRQQQAQPPPPLQLENSHVSPSAADNNLQPRFGQAPQLSTADPSPAMTIDDDSFSSMRPHIMGHPGARIYPVQQDAVGSGSGVPSTANNSASRFTNSVAAGSRVVPNAQLNSDLQKYQQWRAATRSLGVSRDNSLHNQLVLVNLPDPRLSQSRVDRLAVVRPSNANVIVVGARDAAGPSSASVEAIYHVIEGASRARRTRSKDRPVQKGVRGYATLASGSAARTQDTAAPPPTRRAQSAPDTPIHQATLYQRSTQMPSLMQTIEQRQRQQPQQRQLNTSHNGARSPKQGLSQIHVLPAARQNTNVAARPIAIPKSRLGKLQPAHRQMPRSAEVAAEGPVYHRNGSLAVRRPDSIMVFADKPKPEVSASKLEPEPQVEITDSYYDDIGYDLVNTELDSLYCRSFDIDELPDAPERRTSCYNIRKKGMPHRSPSPEKVQSPVDGSHSNSSGSAAKKRQSVRHNGDGPSDDVFVDALESPGNGSPKLEGVTEILSGIPSPVVAQTKVLGPDVVSSTPIASPKPVSTTDIHVPDKNTTSAAVVDTSNATKPITREEDVDFYIRMLSLRSEVPAEELTPPVSPPSQVSPHRQQQQQQQSLLSGKSPSQPVPEERLAGKQQRRRSQSSPMRPTIHRYQQDPVYLGNFWPNGAATFQSEADNVGSGAKCHRSQISCHSLLSRVSLSSRLFSTGKAKDTPVEANSRRVPENRFSEKSLHHATPAANLTTTDTGRARGSSAPVEYTLSRGADQIYRDIEREHTARRNHSLNNRSNSQRTKIEYVPRADRMKSSDAASHFQKRYSSPLATTTAGKEPGSRQRATTHTSTGSGNAGTGAAPRAIRSEPRRGSLASRSSTSKDVSTKPSKSICPSPRWPSRLHWPRSATEDASTTSIYSVYGVEAQRSPYLSHMLNGSWAHIFRSQQAGLAVDQPQRRRRRRERVGDACAYPFHLTYNCLLWWLGPCIGLARECRAMCSTR